MALCMGFDVVGLMAYKPSRNSIMTSGKSQVYRRQVSAKRWRRDRLRRRLGCALPVDLSALRASNCCRRVSLLDARGTRFGIKSRVPSDPGCGFNRADFIHC